MSNTRGPVPRELLDGTGTPSIEGLLCPLDWRGEPSGSKSSVVFRRIVGGDGGRCWLRLRQIETAAREVANREILTGHVVARAEEPGDGVVRRRAPHRVRHSYHKRTASTAVILARHAPGQRRRESAARARARTVCRAAQGAAPRRPRRRPPCGQLAQA